MTARRATIPRATYRLQLTPSFTLYDAAAAVPYLAQLGISHLYLSPIFAAAPGSEHGYDVLDHSRISDELGGISAFYPLRQAADEHGLGIILDIVPNHVGLAGGANRWWRDVMRYGRESAFASYFDIDWEGQAYLPAGLLIYPILGRPFGEALEAGEIRLAFDGREIVVQYFDHTFPTDPRSFALVIGLPPASFATEDSGAPGRLAEVVDALAHAIPDECHALLLRLHELAAGEPAIRSFIESQVEACNGVAGEAASFDRLERILAVQPYRLASWRVSAEEINYRRFFDVNELAAIRVELPQVFDEVHRLVKELADSGLIDGLRVDHIDGLYDPQAYLARLDELLNNADATRRQQKRPIYVEKILAWDERLPEHWATAGTTGYDALARFDRLFVESAGERALTTTYHEFTGRTDDFETVAFGTRRRTAERTFSGELNVLATHLHRLAQSGRLTRDITLRALHDAIAAFVACLPVYRTYLDAGEPRTVDDQIIHWTAREASVRDPNASAEALAFLCDVLLLEGTGDHPEERERRMDFRRRLQQFSGPVMAKGTEDTAFYRYNRLLSLNEVGASPATFGAPPAELHEWLRERMQTGRQALSATTTHDTKRSEDARARLHVLSEIPREWRREVRAWARMNARFVLNGDGWSAPGPNMEYYYYQTLLAAWDGAPTAAFRQRMVTHMNKAVREAKERTSWTRVNQPFEEGVEAFVLATLDGRRSRRFIERVQRFSDRIAGAAWLNSLGMVALKCTAPGIPDFYQGSEGVLTTLTDPDNRLPVDFEKLRALCESDSGTGTSALGARKAEATRALLMMRARRPELFATGEYIPLSTIGSLAEHVFAFLRRHKNAWAMVVIPRTVTNLADAEGRIEPAAWDDTAIQVDAPVVTWRNIFEDQAVAGGPTMLLSELLGTTPVGVFEGQSGR